MSPRKPLRKSNLAEFILEILDRLEEMPTQDLDLIALRAEQIILDREVDENGNYLIH